MATTMSGRVRESITWSIVLSVLMIVSGVLAIWIPAIAGLAVTIAFGWLLIFTGALHLAFAWRGQGAATVIGEVLISLFYAALGVYMIIRPTIGLASLTFAIAVYFFAKGALEAVVAFTLRPLPGSGWLGLDAVLTVAIAAMIASAWPASTAWAVGVLVGVAMISSGATRLMVSLAVRRLVA